MPRNLGIRAATVLPLLLLCSCGAPNEPLAPVPTPSVEGVDPEVRAAVQTAHRQAVAEPENGQASGRLGMVLQANALYPTAVLAYKRAIQLEPGEFAWRYYLGTTLQQQSELGEAADALSAALRIRPDYIPAVIKRGELLFELGRLEESSDVFESLLEEDPKSAQGLYDLARVKYQQGDFKAAEDLYRQATRAYPTFGAAYYGRALAGQRLGREAESVEDFELAERYKDDQPQLEDPVFQQMSDLRTGLLSRVDRAQQFYLHGYPKEASQLFQEVLEQDSDNLDSLLNALFLGPIEGQPSAAKMEAYYTRARQLAPRNPQIYLYYGNVLSEFGKDDAAIATLNKAIELKPDSAEAHTVLGRILEKKNRSSDAIRQYRQALTIDSSFRAARVQLAQILVNLGRYQEAIPELREVIQVDDASTSAALLFLAEAYASTGEVDRALETLQHARTRARKTGPPELLEQIEEGLRQLGSRR